MPSPALRVLVLTPLGTGGMGGIDRMMDAVAGQIGLAPPPDVQVAFGTTRGQGHIAWSPLLVMRVVLGVAGRPFGRRPDLVHINLSSHGSTLRKLAVSRVLRLLGIPYVLHLHGSRFRGFWDKAGATLSAEIRAMFTAAACVIVLGRAWSDYIRSRVPESAERIRILPNATAAAPDRPKRSGDPVVILFLGHVGPRKGVPQLVEALGNLTDRAGWRAVIAGNGAVEQTRIQLTERGLSDRVTMPGWVGPAEVTALLASSDILVLPSFEENLPMSVIEGMAHGLAVVTTPVGATQDIIVDGTTGLLVPPGDATALTNAIARLLDDPRLRGSLGEAARAFHRRHLAIEGYVDRLTDIWRAVATAHRSPAGTAATAARGGVPGRSSHRDSA